MDKVTCIAFILYQRANTEKKKELAIQLLNGDVSLWELKKDSSVLADLTSAEGLFKKKDIDLHLVQEFAAKFLLVEA
jgi:competence protein ComGC